MDQSELVTATELNPQRERLLQFAGLEYRFVRGEGVWLYDDAGRRFLDAYAQYGALALGHNHPALTGALKQALESCTPAMVQPYAAAHAQTLARELYRLAGDRFSRCTFTTSGAEAVEAAIKLVRMRSGRPLVVSAGGSYHGKTMGALAASDRLEFSQQHHQPAQGFARVEYGDAAALARLFHERGSECAGFIVEPIQGEAGVHLPPAGYLGAARKLCDEYGVILIADEIQTGLFRTGSAFAFERDGVFPDVLLVAKALGGGLFPLGACLANEQTWDAQFALSHSSTFANNNLACLVGLAVLQEMQQPAFRENLAAVGAQLEAGLADLAIRHPRAVKEVRGRGLMRAIELREPSWNAGYFLTYLHHQGLSAYLFASVLAKNHGVLVLPVLSDSNVVRIAPALISRPEHIAQLLASLEETLAMWETLSADRIARTAMRASADIATMPSGAVNVSTINPARLQLPRHRARPADAIDYAFLIHPTELGDILLNDPSFARFTPSELEAYCEYSAQLPAGVVCRIPEMHSPTGTRARGALIGIPLLPSQMAQRGRSDVSKAITQAVDLAHERGARIVGLGAFTSIYSRKGLSVVGRGPSITTGNLLTAGMTFRALRWILEERRLAMKDLRVGIVGARGSVGALVAQLVARASPREMVLVGSPNGEIAGVERIASRLKGLGNASIVTGRDLAMLEPCHLIISASSSASPILDAVAVRPGTVICDVARPFDASEAMRERRDITVIDAGLVRLPGTPIRIGVGNLQDHPPGIALACLSETILLSLAGASGNHGIGDDLGVGEVDAMLALAAEHGFALATEGLLPRAPAAAGGNVPHHRVAAA